MTTTAFSPNLHGPRPRRLGALLLAIALTPGLGCGLIKINGKPLGGSATSASPSSGSGWATASGSTASGADAPEVTSLDAVSASGGKTFADVARPGETTPVASWTPAQQYLRAGGSGSGVAQARTRSAVGFGAGFPSLVLADELGDKLSHLGRISLIEECFADADADATSALRWAVCGDDVGRVDLARVEAELRAEKLGRATRSQVLEDSKRAIAAATQIGAAVEAAAAEDPGIAAVLAAGAAARSEWRAYAAAQGPRLEMIRTLQGAARAGEGKGFEGCLAKTRPAFEKLVRGTPIAFDKGRDPLVFYVAQLRGELDSHLITLAYATCAAGLDPSGEGIHAAIAYGNAGTVLRGERTLAFAKLFAPSFKPKFADRSRSLTRMRERFRGTRFPVPGNGIAHIMTPTGGKITKVTRNGEVTTLAFAGDKVHKCLDWRQTDKVTSISSNGDVTYDKTCVRRGFVDSQTGDIEIATVFAAGLKPGVSVTIVNRFPVVAWTGERYDALLGVATR